MEGFADFYRNYSADKFWHDNSATKNANQTIPNIQTLLLQS
jgi:hypothetical protein